MPLEAGDRLGAHEIVSLLGQGGMGEVYRAKDTQLGREVALKVLPQDFAADAERSMRFEREARVLASLNHPNVATLYSFEREDATSFLVMELIEGETLAERIARGPIPVEVVIPLFLQIAAGLEAAHERGVIHRDLKPANVKLSGDGAVKILDFGLATALADGEGSGDPTESPTLTAPPTHVGQIMGTAAYMSPEQARGEAVDERADIWAFGCLLFEALTGRRAFPGGTVMDTLSQVLNGEPHWSDLPTFMPQPLGRLLRRCLRKDPRQRLRDIGDAGLELQAAQDEEDEEGGVVAVRRRAAPARIVALGLGSALLGAVAASWLALRLDSSAGGRRITGVARLTHESGFSEGPSWSPDGNLLAFSSNREGDYEIYVRRIDGGQEINVTANSGDDIQPAFSPDGTQIAFVSTRSSEVGLNRAFASVGQDFRIFGGDVWVMPALGGQARRLVEGGNSPTWHPRGHRLAFFTGPEKHRSISEVDVTDGRLREILSSGQSDAEIVRLRYTPDGSWISFETLEQGVYLLPADGSDMPRFLVTGAHHTWNPSGEALYFARREELGGTRVLSMPFDSRSGETRGSERTLGVLTSTLRDLAAAPDGASLVVTRIEDSLTLSRLPLEENGGRSSGPEEALHTGQIIDRSPAVAPDGRHIAFVSSPFRSQEVWILDLETRQLDTLLLPGSDQGTRSPTWTPDGRLGVVRILDGERGSLWTSTLDGSESEELLPPQRIDRGTFSPDGQSFVYSAVVDEETDYDLHVLDLTTREVRRLTDSDGDNYDPRWSPAGHWIVYAAVRGDRTHIWRVPAAGGEEVALTSGTERFRHCFFSPDGRWVYVQPNHGNIFRVPVEGGALEPVTAFRDGDLFIDEPTISPDGRWMVYTRRNGRSSLWTLLTEDSSRAFPSRLPSR